MKFKDLIEFELSKNRTVKFQPPILGNKVVNPDSSLIFRVYSSPSVGPPALEAKELVHPCTLLKAKLGISPSLDTAPVSTLIYPILGTLEPSAIPLKTIPIRDRGFHLWAPHP